MKFKSINTKIIFMVTSVALLLTIAFVLSTGILCFNIIEDTISDDSVKKVESYADTVGTWFGERLNEAKVYSNTPIIRNMNYKEIDEYISSEMQKKTKDYRFMGTVDNEGNYCINVAYHLNNAEQEKYLKNAMYERDTLSKPLISSIDGKENVVISTPIYNDNHVKGAFMIGIDLTKMYEFIDIFKNYTDNGYVYIIDKDGTVIAQRNKNVLLKENITKQSPYISKGLENVSHNILGNYKGEVIYKENGEDKIAYFHNISNTEGWKLVLITPKKYIMIPIIKVFVKLAMIGFLTIMLGSFLARFVAKSISSPIIAMTEIFNKAAEGDLTVTADDSGCDELSIAAKSFNFMMKTVSNMTYLDPLTGILNRESFTDRLGVQIKYCKSKGEQLAVFVIAIDKFKKVNDAHGLAVGDDVLKYLTDKLRNFLREEAVLARMSGDEFLILFPQVKSHGVTLGLAKELTEIVKESFNIKEKEFHITSSIGIAMYPQDGDNENVLIKHAGVAKSKAKELGGDRIKFYSHDMNKNLEEQLTLDNMLHNALQKNEFVVHYQPFVSLDTGKIEAAEALIRWNSRSLGMIPPAKFIPRAEENGLIIPIGKWVMREACRQNKEWQDQGLKPICVSVNVSVVQFEQEDFVDMVSEIIEDTGLDPKYLELEITEGVAMQNVEDKIGKLLRLKEIGVKISIDDFGTGYSSLSYLKKFPIDNLKIDQSFVRDINTNENAKAIVSTIISMGNNLKLGLIAEGVESSEQFEFIKSQNCDKVQGYLFSKPLDNHTFTNMLEKDKCFC